MTNSKRYNMFILFSTISRNIVEVFSSLLLYKMGYSIRDIFLFFSILYLIGGVTSIFSLKSIKRIDPKYLLVISSILFSLSFYFVSIMKCNYYNLILFSLLYGSGSYMYHSMRHFYAFLSLDNDMDNRIGNIVIYSNIAIIISSVVSIFINRMSFYIIPIVVIIISLISNIFLLKFNTSDKRDSIVYEKISKDKILFFIFEQGKVISLSLEPLYLYIFIADKIEYALVFNIVFLIASAIFIFFFVRRVDYKKYFKYINILFCIILLVKLNISNKYLVLFIGFLEGIFVKMFEVVSQNNLYDIKNKVNTLGYFIEVLSLFCFVRFILSILFFIINDIRISMYISILFIFILSFIPKYSLHKVS